MDPFVPQPDDFFPGSRGPAPADTDRQWFAMPVRWPPRPHELSVCQETGRRWCALCGRADVECGATCPGGGT